MKKQGILFDFNGVIAHDEHLHEAAMEDVMANHGIALSHELYVRLCLGRTDMTAFQNLQHTFAEISSFTIPELINEKVDRYRQLAQSASVLHPKISEIATELSRHYKLGIVTGALWEEIKPALHDSGILKCFAGVISANDITRSKPDPEGYQKGIELLQLPAETIVAVEDTPSGVQAAKSAGLACIAVEGTVSKDQLTHADATISALSKLTVELIEAV